MEWIPAKTILSKNKSLAWFCMEYNCNLYKGCCHGCIYCDSRSECYGIENFDQVRAKADAIAILEKELKSKRQKGVVGMGSMSDPYNPFEKEQQLTRQALAAIDHLGFGAAIATKSPLVTRDGDLLQSISKHSPVLVKLSITTCQDSLARLVEPYAAASSQRFAAIKQLTEQGVYAGVLFGPILPFLEDTAENIEGMVLQAKASGARFIYATWGVTLRQNQRLWYYQQLDQKFPGLKQQYIRQYGNTYECHCIKAKELWPLFQQLCQQHGLLYRMQDIILDYRAAYEQKQLVLF